MAQCAAERLVGEDAGPRVKRRPGADRIAASVAASLPGGHARLDRTAPLRARRQRWL